MQAALALRLTYGQDAPDRQLQGPAFLLPVQHRRAEHMSPQQIHSLLPGTHVDARRTLHQHTQQPLGPATASPLVLRKALPIHGVGLQDLCSGIQG